MIYNCDEGIPRETSYAVDPYLEPRPTGAQVALGAFVLQIELVVVSDQVVLESPHPGVRRSSLSERRD